MRWSSPAKLRFLPFPPSFVAALSVLLVFRAGRARYLPAGFPRSIAAAGRAVAGTVLRDPPGQTGFLSVRDGDGLGPLSGREFFVFRSDPQCEQPFGQRGPGADGGPDGVALDRDAGGDHELRSVHGRVQAAQAGGN